MWQSDCHFLDPIQQDSNVPRAAQAADLLAAGGQGRCVNARLDAMYSSMPYIAWRGRCGSQHPHCLLHLEGQGCSNCTSGVTGLEGAARLQSHLAGHYTITDTDGAASECDNQDGTT